MYSTLTPTSDQRTRTLIARGQIAIKNGDIPLLKRTIHELSYMRHMVNDSLKSFASQEHDKLKQELDRLLQTK